MDQEWHETVGRERDWVADQLGTPWAMQVLNDRVQVVNVRLEPMLHFNLPNSLAAVVAAEVIKVVNDRY